MSQWSEGMELMGRRLVGERYESVVCEERREKERDVERRRFTDMKGEVAGVRITEWMVVGERVRMGKTES